MGGLHITSKQGKSLAPLQGCGSCLLGVTPYTDTHGRHDITLDIMLLSWHLESSSESEKCCHGSSQGAMVPASSSLDSGTSSGAQRAVPSNWDLLLILHSQHLELRVDNFSGTANTACQSLPGLQ